MAFTPHTIVRLCNVPITPDYKNTINFANVSAQAAYFVARAVTSFSDFTYSRQDSVLSVPAEIDAIYNCNYVMYQNSNFSNKWFYAFITSMEYVNQNTTRIFIKTDVFQTWLFEMNLRPSFIARQTVANDTKFLHTLPENIDTGGAKCQVRESCDRNNVSFSAQTLNQFNNNYWVCIITSAPISFLASEPPQVDSFMGGVANCSYFYAVDTANIKYFFYHVNDSGQAGAVVNCFALPKSFAVFHAIDSDRNIGYLTDIDGSVVNSKTINKPLSDIDGYTPKNNKLFCYPYNYLEIESTNGANRTFRYEWFNNPNSPTFEVQNWKVVCAQPQYVSCVLRYGCDSDTLYSDSLDNAVILQNFPQIPWIYSAYANYMALNANTLAFSFLSSGISAGVGAAMGNPLAVAHSALGVAGNLAGLADRQKQPEELRGNVSGNASMYSGLIGNFYKFMTIRAEYAEIIDEYFSRYGYAVNCVSDVSFTNRPVWDYLQTVEIDIDGTIPADDKKELCGIFNSGVTVWHNPATFGDYSQDNPAPTR